MIFRKLAGIGIVSIVVAMLTAATGAGPAGAATITVNSTGDAVSDAGQCVLREAINAANTDTASGVTPGECAAGSGADTVVFNFDPLPGPHTLVPATEMPVLTSLVTIDATAEAHEVILDGSAAAAAPGSQIGFDIQADGASVKGLTIGNWDYGVYVFDADDVSISGNRIGIDLGDSARPNGVVGIQVEGDSDRTQVGSNVISGNAQQGLRMVGGQVGDPLITGNRIGTNNAGDAAIPNGEGIWLSDTTGAVVGGDTVAEGNLISGHPSTAINLTGGPTDYTSNVLIQGNTLGLNAAGDAALGNLSGVHIVGDVRDSVIEDNVISGSTQWGIDIGPVFGVTETPSGLKIAGNRIGTNSAGTAAIPNTFEGIKVDAAGSPFGAGILIGGITGLTPGGPCTGDCNLISGNLRHGVAIDDGSQFVSILGNSIVGNQLLGIDLRDLALSGGTPLVNDADDVDGGSNGFQNHPVLQAALNQAGKLRVTGILNSVADRNYRIEIFGNGAADSSGYGEGETFLGAFTVSNAPGQTSVGFAETLSVPVATGNTLVATATVLDPVTGRPASSEFSINSTEGCDQSGDPDPNELTASAGGEAICGQGGADVLKSGVAGDILRGDAGSDSADFSGLPYAVSASLASGLARAIPLASGVADILFTVENLRGSPQDDTLTGDTDTNVILGGAGDDEINPGGGPDSVYGGPDDDTINVVDGLADNLIDCGTGVDTVTADPTATEPASLFVDCETINRPGDPPPTCETDPDLCPPPTCETDESLCPPEPVVYKCDGIKATIVGTNHDETINGTNQRDVIVARAGKDKINPKKGNDLICAGDGVDSVSGSGGNDRALGQDGADNLKGGDGNDKLLGGAKDDKLYGHAHGDILKGGEGSDRLEGGANADTLYGEGHGKDRLFGNSGFDKLSGGDGGKDQCDGGTNKDRKKAPGCEQRKRLP